jgi:hypothetical protein
MTGIRAAAVIVGIAVMLAGCGGSHAPNADRAITSATALHPDLGPFSVRFTDLAANGAAPARARLSSDWLTEANGYLAPGPWRDDAFTLRHAPTAGP